jgi:hypothetical protein
MVTPPGRRRAVFAVVKTATRRPRRVWPAASLDRGCGLTGSRTMHQLTLTRFLRRARAPRNDTAAD